MVNGFGYNDLQNKSNQDQITSRMMRDMYSLREDVMDPL